MGIIGKAHDWYENHRLVKTIATALEGCVMLNASAADLAAETFFCQPAAVAQANQTEEAPKLNVGGDFRTFGRYIDGTAGLDRRAVETRARLNLGYQPSDYLNIGVRIVAEYSTTPSFDHRLEDGKEFFLDRAFADFKLNEELWLTLGAYDNAFTGWCDSDIPLVGAQLGYSKNNALKLDRIKAKLAYHMGQPWLDESDSNFWAFEAEGLKELTNDWDLFCNAGYQHWFGLDEGFIRTNARKGAGYASRFNTVNGKIKLVHGTENIPVFKGPVELYATGMHNFGATDKNNGLILGVGLGHLKNPGDSRLTLEYRYIEADAVNAGYTPKVTPCTDFKKPVIFLTHRLTDKTLVTVGYAFPGRIGNGDNWNYGHAGFIRRF